MAEVINLFSKLLTDYNDFSKSLPDNISILINILLLTIFVVVYCVFVWNFYKFMSKKDIIKLNLSQYNTTNHPGTYKFLAFILYIIEYLFLFPVLIFFWFSVFTIFLILLTETLTVSELLLISATAVATVRILSYYHKSLSEDVAKLIPLTLLVISITTQNFFSIERIITQISEMPLFFHKVLFYLAFIVVLEFILRMLDLLVSAAFNKKKKIDKYSLV